ncbi:hypothetical protein ACL2XP_17805 [Sodalis sp. RH21]
MMKRYSLSEKQQHIDAWQHSGFTKHLFFFAQSNLKNEIVD